MIHTYVFPNGLRVIYEKSRNNIAITDIQVFCKIGSSMETPDMRGVSHLVEHMVFKGTKHRPLSKNISHPYDKAGAYFNANTDKSYTNYIVKCQDAYVRDCIIVLADMLMNSTFNKVEFEKEKKVIVEENIRMKDDVENTVFELVDSSIYKETVYEFPIDTLSYHKKSSLPYEKVFQFYKMFYRPNNMGVSIISNISFSKIIKILTQSDLAKLVDPISFDDNTITSTLVPSSGVLDINISPYSHTLQLYPQLEPRFILHPRKDINVMYLCIGFRTCSQYSKDKYALNVLKNILGGYMNARLFTILRESNGLTYTSQAYTEYYDILGNFSILSETDPEKILVHKGNGKGVLPLIIDIITDLQKNGVSKAELYLSKQNLHGSMVLSEEVNTNACFYNGSQLVLYDNELKSIDSKRDITSYHDRYAKYYKNITQKDIHDVIKKYFTRQNMTVCLLGKNIPDVKVIRRTCNTII
jgi:predicted Zn-dependent peptidase